MVANRTGIGRSGMDLVDEFNDPNGDKFAFLISTRAGGVGLNLKAANKVGSFSRSRMAVLLSGGSVTAGGHFRSELESLA